MNTLLEMFHWLDKFRLTCKIKEIYHYLFVSVISQTYYFTGEINYFLSQLTAKYAPNDY
jgi:hypothetical protein